MSDKLKIFVTQNKNSFDTLVPSADVWAKVDAGLTVTQGHWIKSKSLAKFLKLGFGASVIAGTTYIVSSNLEHKPAPLSTQNQKQIITTDRGVFETQLNQKPIENSSLPVITNTTIPNNKRNNNVSLVMETPKDTVGNNSNITKNDSVSVPMIILPVKGNSMACNSPFTNKIGPKAFNPSILNIYDDKKVNETNTYSGTLLKEPYCTALNSFKFPGEVAFEGCMTNNDCSDLINLKGVWLKGLTDKPFIVKLANSFKNIILIKPNGDILYPTAISHFSEPGSVISLYTGKKFNIAFKDRVEIILFFKDAEKGDKIVIDKSIEAVVN